LKLGERGIIPYRQPDFNVRSFFTVDSFVEHLVDAVGAGDALLAAATLAHVITANPVIASILGSVAAALACEREGNTPIEPKEMIDRLDRLEKQADMQPVPELRKRTAAA